MKQGRALTAKGRAARAIAAKWMREWLSLPNMLHATATEATATNEVN